MPDIDGQQGVGYFPAAQSPPPPVASAGLDSLATDAGRLGAAGAPALSHPFAQPVLARPRAAVPAQSATGGAGPRGFEPGRRRRPSQVARGAAAPG